MAATPHSSRRESSPASPVTLRRPSSSRFDVRPIAKYEEIRRAKAQRQRRFDLTQPRLGPADRGGRSQLDVYDPSAAKQLCRLLVIGDDFQGCCVAFDPESDWSIVEIDPVDKSTEVVAVSFGGFVRAELLVE